MKRTIAFLMVGLALFCTACNRTAQELKDGYYTAVAADYNAYGWKEYVTIYVNNSVIATVEYNAKNSSGFIKSWDMEHMRRMNEANGTYPNAYFRAYAVALLERQNPAEVDAVTGATHSHATFQLLTQAAIDRSKAGDVSVAFVELPAVE